MMRARHFRKDGERCRGGLMLGARSCNLFTFKDSVRVWIDRESETIRQEKKETPTKGGRETIWRERRDTHFL